MPAADTRFVIYLELPVVLRQFLNLGIFQDIVERDTEVKVLQSYQSTSTPWVVRQVRRGYVFPLILFATLAVAIFIITMTQFQSANRVKFQHLNDYQSAFNIAYSALVEVLADIQSKQWSNRSFKAGPNDKSADLFGGKFNLRVEDHDANSYLFNVKVRVSYKNKNHLFYWRLKYNPNLLDFTNFVIPVFYEDMQNPSGDIDDIVDKILEKRQENREKALEIADSLKPANTIEEALKKIGVNPGDVNGADTPRPADPGVTIPPTDVTTKDIKELVENIDPKVTFAIKNFYFGGDVSVLTEEQKDLLDSLAKILKDRPNIKIELRGHATGVVGTPESNMEFSIERAQNVADYLTAVGISTSRLTVKGYGMTRNIASNDTEAGKAKNRRVEFVLIESPS